MYKLNGVKPLELNAHISFVDKCIEEIMAYSYKQLDTSYWQFIHNITGNEGTISIFNDNIIHQSFSRVERSYLKWRITVSIDHVVNKEWLSNEIEKIFKLLDHRPVKDEDLYNSSNGIMSFRLNDEGFHVSSWIIPGIREGIWENHSLPKIK